MKKAILITACLFSFTTIITAQETASKPGTEKKGRETPEQRAQKQLNEISKELVLTEDQKPKVYTLVLDKVKKVDDLKMKYKSGEDNSVRDKEIKVVKKEFHEKVKALLTPEQLEKAKAIQKEKEANEKKPATGSKDK